MGQHKAKSYTAPAGALSMRILLVVLGVLVSLAGAVWSLQGAGFLLGSFMSNDPTWLWIGVITALIGVGILGLGIWSGRAAKHA